MLGQIPPWLNVGPTDYLHAIQAGTNTGLQVAEAQNRAQAAIAARALAQQKQAQDAWEFGERMRLAAEQHAQQGEYQSGLLDWHRQQLENDAQKAAMGDERARERLEETISHNLETERLKAEEQSQSNVPTEVNLDPSKYYVTRGGAVVQPRREVGQISPSAALNVVSDPMKWAFAQNAFGPQATNLVNIAKGGFMPRSPQSDLMPTNALPQLGTNMPPGEIIRYTKDGRAAVFDATTKRFLRYAE